MAAGLRTLLNRFRPNAGQSADPAPGFDAYLNGVLRAKWVELPAGSDRSERQFSTGLMDWPLQRLMTFWDEQFKVSEDVRGWYRALYAPLFQGKRVLEIGSGMGYDGIYFMQHGAKWQFSDIAADNQTLIRRVAEAKGLQPVGFLVIEALKSFDALPRDFDFVWANGSLLNVPFEISTEECAVIIRHLKLGGRWIELAYPYERWSREGSPPFSKWGKMTDGERTPWVEWYDIEKLKQRLAPHIMTPVFDLRFSSDSYIWMDLIHTGRIAEQVIPRTEIPPPEAITTPNQIWHSAHTIPLIDYLDQVRGDISADITCRVTEGAVGFVFLGRENNSFTGREQILDGKTTPQRVTITGSGAETGSLLIRNTSGRGASKVAIDRITLRSAL